MSLDHWEPDVLIGVDFGMTCTAVAWSMGPDWAPPKTIQHWPGKLGHELQNKVDSAVSYDIATGDLVNWGFQCSPESETEEYNELFKLYLDPAYQENSESAPSREEVHRWFVDYESQPRFSEKRVEFVFSVPTTWKNPAVVATIERLLNIAGYGVLNKERAQVYLTEAEAAAVYASGRSLQRNDVFLICDAGGGTTDVNILKLTSEPNRMTAMKLEPLCWTEGSAAGAALIDFRVSRLLAERLSHVRDEIDGDFETIALKMMGNEYQRVKCSFGAGHAYDAEFRLPIPGLRSGVDMASARIVSSCVVLTMQDLKVIFDEQANKVLALIDQQLRTAGQSWPGEHVSYLILSGGFGSSPYLRSRVRERYQDRVGREAPPNAANMQLILVDEPQLAVVHGLVMARIQERKCSSQVLARRYAPYSYGVVCRQRYRPEKHQQQQKSLDEFDRSEWASGQIPWVVRQAEFVDGTARVCKRYRMRIPRGQEGHTWKINVVMSASEPSALPQSVREGAWKPLCDVHFSLHPKDLSRKNHHWYSVGGEYMIADFELRVLMQTGLRFEVWGKDGRRSKAHDELAVEWIAELEG